MYRRLSAGVNRGPAGHRRLAAWVSFSVVAGLGLVASGCAATAKVARSPQYVIAVRYDVEPVFVEEGSSGVVDTIRRDFRAISQLGFNAVALRHVDDRDRGLMLGLAADSGLRIALPDRGFRDYLRIGALPGDCGTLRDLVAGVPGELLRHPATQALALDCGSGRAATERCTELCALIGELGSNCVTTGSDPARHGLGSLAEIDASRGASPVEEWLAGFHRGLITGRTAGLVVDRYRRPVGDAPGLAARGEPLTPARAAAVRELITRARLWGPRLRGAAVEPLAGVGRRAPDLHAVSLIRGPRRYVLIFNPSSERYARGEIVLPESIGGAAVGRAVEVPPSADRPPTRVIGRGRGRVVFTVALRPGDAALYEVF